MFFVILVLFYPKSTKGNRRFLTLIQEPKKTIEAVFEVACATGLFGRNDIKVRLNPFRHSLVQDSDNDFIHVFANIMEGRTAEQKANLSKVIVVKLNEPQIELIKLTAEFDVRN